MSGGGDHDAGEPSADNAEPSCSVPPPANRQKLKLVAWAALAIAVLAGSAAASYAWIANERRAETKAALETVLETTHQALQTWSRDQQAIAQTWAASPDLVRYAEELLRLSPTRDALLASPAQVSLRALLAPVLATQKYAGYFVIGPNDVSLASSRNQNVGTKNLLLFQAGVLGRLWGGAPALSLPQVSDVPLPDADGNPVAAPATMFAGAPVKNASGDVIALLTFRIIPWRDFTQTLQQGRIGDSGETYSFDFRGRMISESRFDDQLREMGLISPSQRGILNIEIRDPGVNLAEGKTTDVARESQPLTVMAASAVAGEKASNVEGYRDYRGVEVVGAWMWDPELGYGIATEIDEEEAFGALRLTGVAIFSITGIAILLVVGLAIVFNQIRRQGLELQERLAKVLSGYIPICSSCKMIRDDSGEWYPVEHYVSARTEAQFSHSICPKCGKDLYGDLYDARS